MHKIKINMQMVQWLCCNKLNLWPEQDTNMWIVTKMAWKMLIYRLEIGAMNYEIM